MRTYRASNVPDKLDAAFVRGEFRAVEEAANASDPLIALTYIGVAPKKPENGIYLADAGVLGVSRGAYRYDTTTGLFTFIA